MRNQREDQDRWHREGDERRGGEQRMRYDYGRDRDDHRGRQEERGSFREEGHSRWQGGQWQGEYPGREELRRSGGNSDREHDISRDEYLRHEARGSRDEYRSRDDRGSERWREQGSGWSSPSEYGRNEIHGGRQEQGRWGLSSERSGEGRMRWEDHGGDRRRSTDSGEYRTGSRSQYDDRSRYEERSRYDDRDRRSDRGREEYRSSDRDRAQSRESGSGHDISGTWRQFGAWGDSARTESRSEGLGVHRRESGYGNHMWSQGDHTRDDDR